MAEWIVSCSNLRITGKRQLSNQITQLPGAEMQRVPRPSASVRA
jgi:hypothetical protein